jgi:hypothetical protein
MRILQIRIPNTAAGMKLTWRRGTQVAEERAAAVRNIRRTSETALCTR